MLCYLEIFLKLYTFTFLYRIMFGVLLHTNLQQKMFISMDKGMDIDIYGYGYEHLTNV